MYKDNLDLYVSTFGNLARQAGYNPDAGTTIHLFTRGLKPELLQAILLRDNKPNIMIEWQDAARREQHKHAFKQAMLNPSSQQFQWQVPKGNRHRRHSNDETVPMDVNQPIFTQVR